MKLRSKNFFKEIGNTLKNVQIFFSIDGLDDYTNQRYRRRVNTRKAIENMLTHRNTLYGKDNTWWKYIIFEHNWFKYQKCWILQK